MGRMNVFEALNVLAAKKAKKRRPYRKITRLSAWWAKWQLIAREEKKKRDA